MSALNRWSCIQVHAKAPDRWVGAVPRLVRFPAVDPTSFEARVRRVCHR